MELRPRRGRGRRSSSVRNAEGTYPRGILAIGPNPDQAPLAAAAAADGLPELPIEMAGLVLAFAHAASIPRWPPTDADDTRMSYHGGRSEVLRWAVMERMRSIWRLASVCRTWFWLIYFDPLCSRPIWRDVEWVVRHTPWRGVREDTGSTVQCWTPPRADRPGWTWKADRVRRQVMRYAAGVRRGREWDYLRGQEDMLITAARFPHYRTLFLDTWGFHVLRSSRTMGFKSKDEGWDGNDEEEEEDL